MVSNKHAVVLVIAAIFVIGAGYIVYQGRPVMQMEQVPGIADPAAPASSGPKTYTMADVQAHNSRSSCWAAIRGNVYDLTSWISRHPGGPQRILGLCGTDGTTAFTNQHGSAPKPAAMLVLLKIGTLQ